jgi:hypothetical protein
MKISIAGSSRWAVAGYRLVTALQLEALIDPAESVRLAHVGSARARNSRPRSDLMPSRATLADSLQKNFGEVRLGAGTPIPLSLRTMHTDRLQHHDES